MPGLYIDPLGDPFPAAIHAPTLPRGKIRALAGGRRLLVADYAKVSGGQLAVPDQISNAVARPTQGGFQPVIEQFSDAPSLRYVGAGLSLGAAFDIGPAYTFVFVLAPKTGGDMDLIGSAERAGLRIRLGGSGIFNGRHNANAEVFDNAQPGLQRDVASTVAICWSAAAGRWRVLINKALVVNQPYAVAVVNDPTPVLGAGFVNLDNGYQGQMPFFFQSNQDLFGTGDLDWLLDQLAAAYL